MTVLVGTSKYSYDLGSFGRKITTDNDEAQTWFNRGLAWLFGFNLQESAFCFRQAILRDGSCAMAYWGLAYALGPHYNRSWESFGNELESATKETYNAARKALSLASNTTPLERALIEAIQTRYQSDHPTNAEKYAEQSREYADALGKVCRDFGEDLDVVALFADSLISLTPWKLWNLWTGEPKEGTRTLEAKQVLEKALQNEAAFKHPGVLHMYIHLIEMSPQPELGLKAADCLRDLVPEAGHLLHMPSHLDILVGNYSAALLANQKAVVADEKFLERNGPENFYSVYRMHDYHSLIFAAMFAGKKALALDAVDRMEKSVPHDLLVSGADFMEAFYAVRWHVMVRFGLWDEIIQAELPLDPNLMLVTTTTAHYAKGVAWAASKNVAEAEKERALFHEALKSVPDTRLDYPNKCNDILQVGTAMLDGEVEYRRGNYKEAFEHLRRSVELDDGLVYSEPWGWMQPARHALAALLLEQDHLEEALSVYRADLGLDDSCFRARHHPKNVWALQGYHECLVRLGRLEEARLVEPELKKALGEADVPINSSCFCRLDTALGEGSGCCS